MRRDKVRTTRGGSSAADDSRQPHGGPDAGSRARGTADNLGDWTEQRAAELAQVAADADPRPETRADVDPEALAVVASVEADFAAIEGNLARAQMRAEQLAEKRGRDQAERKRAAAYEPVIHTEP